MFRIMNKLLSHCIMQFVLHGIFTRQTSLFPDHEAEREVCSPFLTRLIGLVDETTQPQSRTIAWMLSSSSNFIHGFLQLVACV